MKREEATNACNVIRNERGEIIMSWYCQMVGEHQMCMEWKDYIKTGWSLANSFAVETHGGVSVRKQ